VYSVLTTRPEFRQLRVKSALGDPSELLSVYSENKDKIFNFKNDTESNMIENLLKTLPRVPVAEGSPMKTIKPAVLKSRGKLELNQEERIDTMGPNGPVIAEVLSNGDIGQMTQGLEDGTNFPTTFLGDTYLKSDIDKLKNPEIVKSSIGGETMEKNLQDNRSRFDLKISELEQAIKLYSSLALRLNASDEKMVIKLRSLSDKISEVMAYFDMVDKSVDSKNEKGEKKSYTERIAELVEKYIKDPTINLQEEISKLSL
jgi:hypothetical protein